MTQRCDLREMDQFGAPCRTCAHIVAAHTRPDNICSICQAVEQIKAEILRAVPTED